MEMNILKLTITFTAVLLIGSVQFFGQPSRPLITETSDGGSMVLSEYAHINKESALHRSWHTVNDSTCPIQLVKAGVRTEEYLTGYNAVVGAFAAKEPITALEMRFALYDVFDEHIVTLETTWVEDVASPGSFMFKNNSPVTTQRAPKLLLFRADPNDVERLLTVISFVSKVRTKSGTVWRYDPAAMVSEVARLLHSKVDETTLIPTIVPTVVAH
jgi:hypothetical protein